MSALSSDSGRKRSCHEGKTPVGGLAGSKFVAPTHFTTAVLLDTDFVYRAARLLSTFASDRALF